MRFPLDKPSSDNSWTFIRVAEVEFGKEMPIQQCCVHFTGRLHFQIYVFFQFFGSFQYLTWLCTVISWKKMKFRSKFIHRAPSSSYYALAVGNGDPGWGEVGEVRHFSSGEKGQAVRQTAEDSPPRVKFRPRGRGGRRQEEGRAAQTQSWCTFLFVAGTVSIHIHVTHYQSNMFHLQASDGSECGRDRQLFGQPSIRPEIVGIQNIINLKLNDVWQSLIIFCNVYYFNT